ncbi:hypothetical protein [Streptomyces sp. NPDC058674]|uniref:hypothetical protein n=1 Tax=Streptomyces sp. NPDC058674 TaxID=3346592 RepID=UPI00365171C7
MNDRQRDEHSVDSWESSIVHRIARESASEAETNEALRKVLERAGRIPSNPGPEISPARATPETNEGKGNRLLAVLERQEPLAGLILRLVRAAIEGDDGMVEEAISRTMGMRANDLDLGHALGLLWDELAHEPELETEFGIVDSAVRGFIRSPDLRVMPPDEQRYFFLRRLVLLASPGDGAGRSGGSNGGVLGSQSAEAYRRMQSPNYSG